MNTYFLGVLLINEVQRVGLMLKLNTQSQLENNNERDSNT